MSLFTFKFEAGHRITFIRALFITAGAIYVSCFLFGLMTFAFIGMTIVGLQKLRLIDVAFLANYKDKLDGDMFLAVGIPLLGLLVVLLSFAVSKFFKRLTN